MSLSHALFHDRSFALGSIGVLAVVEEKIAREAVILKKSKT